LAKKNKQIKKNYLKLYLILYIRMPEIGINSEGLLQYEKMMNRLETIRANNRKNASKYYKKNYTITEEMGIEERLIVNLNIQQRKIASKEKYEKNKAHYQQKQREYRARLKEQSNKKKIIVDFD